MPLLTLHQLAADDAQLRSLLDEVAGTLAPADRCAGDVVDLARVCARLDVDRVRQLVDGDVDALAAQTTLMLHVPEPRLVPVHLELNSLVRLLLAADAVERRLGALVDDDARRGAWA